MQSCGKKRKVKAIKITVKWFQFARKQKFELIKTKYT